MLINFTKISNIFIACEKIDLAKGIDCLVAFVTEIDRIDIFD